ncbi:hypothetical protein GTQ40_07455 [Flavobacteriaceae bacterium R38]|nr:hypothetical protein [Flavobacteriaceae bacterium R38]
MRTKILQILLVLIFIIPNILDAHATNQSYIFLRISEATGLDGRYEIQVRDLNKVFGWDYKNDTEESVFEPYLPQIQEYLLEHSDFNSVLGKHKVTFTGFSILRLADGDYAQFHFELDNDEVSPEELDVTYSAVFDSDNTHKGFLIVESNWKAGIINNERMIALDFTPSKTTSTLSLTDSSVWRGFMAMVRQGVWHIWIGLDHILFLLALILPSVVRRIKEQENNKLFDSWTPEERFKPTLMYVLKVITFFTIAHTITLSLATLEIVNLPSQIVETIIAFSIGLAAFHNIRPIFKGKDWVIAFIFGLFHGFGFASVLGDLGLTGEFLTISLLGFNVGVEVGQLAIIFAIFPILFLIRKRNVYPKVLVFGSLFLILMSTVWCVERIFDVDTGVEGNFLVILHDTAVWLGLK